MTVIIDFSKGFNTKEVDKLLDNLAMMDEPTKLAIKGQVMALEVLGKILTPKGI